MTGSWASAVAHSGSWYWQAAACYLAWLGYGLTIYWWYRPRPQDPAGAQCETCHQRPTAKKKGKGKKRHRRQRK